MNSGNDETMVQLHILKELQAQHDQFELAEAKRMRKVEHANEAVLYNNQQLSPKGQVKVNKKQIINEGSKTSNYRSGRNQNKRPLGSMSQNEKSLKNTVSENITFKKSSIGEF